MREKLLNQLNRDSWVRVLTFRSEHVNKTIAPKNLRWDYKGVWFMSKGFEENFHLKDTWEIY